MLLLAHWEFYVLAVPYMIFGFWAYRWIGRRAFTNWLMLLAAGIMFWLVFLAGLLVVSFAAEVFIMFRYAEHV